MAKKSKEIDRSEVLQSLLDFCTDEANNPRFYFEDPKSLFQQMESHEILAGMKMYREAGYMLSLLDKWYNRNKKKRSEMDLEMIESLKAALVARWVSQQ